MITVHTVRSCPSGFSMYQRQPEAMTYPDLFTVEEYVTYIREECPDFTDLAQNDERVRAVDGATYDQNGGMIVGWEDRDGIGFEVVYVS